MADPQTENGYLKIAMEVVEALGRYRIPGQEMQLVWALLRKTWGWNKKADHISLSQFSKLTGINRSNCSHIVNRLISKNIIKKAVVKSNNTLTSKYIFNKDYETWKTVVKKPTGVRSNNKVVSEVTTKVVSEVTPTIYNIDTYQYIMSELLFKLIKSRRNNLKKPNLRAWSKHIDMMIRIDKRDPEEIRQVIEWCQADTFWQNNILSTDKLRKQYDQLALNMGRGSEIASAPKYKDHTGIVLERNPKHNEFMRGIGDIMREKGAQRLTE